MPTNPRLVFRNNLARDPETGRYHARIKVHGRPHQRSFSSKRAALLWLEALELRRAGVELEGEPTPTLAEARDAYVERLKLLNRSDATQDYYHRHVHHLLKALGKATELDEVTQRAVEAYVAARKTQVSAGTVNKELRALVTIYRHAGVEPRWSLPALSHHPRRRRVHSPAQLRTLWDTLSPPARVPLGLCLLAGLRASEAMAAVPAWRVGDDELEVRVRKTEGWNRTWLCPTLREALAAAPLPVAVDLNALQRELVAGSRTAGITPPLTGPGAGRHHCATWAVDAGCTRDQVREVLSHASGSVTDRYVHSHAIATKRRVLEAVERVFLGLPST